MAGEKINDGGPAFPQIAELGDIAYAAHAGMSLRDWFAGQFLAGIATKFEFFEDARPLPKRDAKEAATDAYAIADAMLKARGQ